jgi:TRAP-type C4-dicarboxylate transport system substrate-binding protein
MKFKMAALFVCIMVALSGISLFIEESKAETVNLKFSSPWPPPHPQHTMVIQPWAKKIGELTKGQVKITLFPGEALGKAADHYDMAAKGVCDIALTVPMYTPVRIPGPFVHSFRKHSSTHSDLIRPLIPI